MRNDEVDGPVRRILRSLVLVAVAAAAFVTVVVAAEMLSDLIRG